MIGRITAKAKAHLVFGAAIAAILTLGVLTKIWAGQTFGGAFLNGIKEVRPVEWAMLVMFWYAMAFPPQLDRWHNKYRASLGLNEPK